jgi:hypothetical protein
VIGLLLSFALPTPKEEPPAPPAPAPSAAPVLDG